MTGRLRLTGLAGSVLLAAGGFLAGARPGPAPANQADALWGDTAAFRLGLLAYLVGLVVLGWAWWRLYRQPLRLRWVLVTGALWALPLLVAPPLGSRDVYAYACHGAVWLDGHDPYAVGAAGGACPWLEAVPSLWHGTPAPYGPLALLVSAAAVGLARLLASGESAQLLVAIGGLRAAAVLGALLVAAYGPRLARACGLDPAAAAWLGLVTPLVGVHVVAGAHHDALVAGLVVAGLSASTLRGWGLFTPFRGPNPSPTPVGPAIVAGVALGLAVAVKVTAVAALPFAVLLVAHPGPPLGRAGGDLAPGNVGNIQTQDRPTANQVGSGAVLVLAFAGAFAALTVATGLGLGWVGALSKAGAIGQWSSLPTGLGMAVGYLLRGLGAPEAFDATVTVARWLGLAVLAVVCAGLLVRAWRVRQDTRAVVAAVGAVLAAVVMLGPVLYPWYAVGALAVLAASTEDARVRRWLAVATLVLTALTLPSGLGVPVVTRLPGALLVALLVSWVGWRWLRGRAPRKQSTPL